MACVCRFFILRYTLQTLFETPCRRYSADIINYMLQTLIFAEYRRTPCRHYFWHPADVHSADIISYTLQTLHPADVFSYTLQTLHPADVFCYTLQTLFTITPCRRFFPADNTSCRHYTLQTFFSCRQYTLQTFFHRRSTLSVQTKNNVCKIGSSAGCFGSCDAHHIFMLSTT